MNTDPADPVAAYLEQVHGLITRRDQLVARLARVPVRVEVLNAAQDRLAERTAPLVAAVEAVLALHQPGRVMIMGAMCGEHEPLRHFSITRTEAAGIRDCPDCMATVLASCTGCSGGIPFDYCPNRKAAAAELLGEAGTDD